VVSIYQFLLPPLQATSLDDACQGQREEHHDGKYTKAPPGAGGMGKRFLNGNANTRPDAPY
jgi:hypothetical protein